MAKNIEGKTVHQQLLDRGLTEFFIVPKYYKYREIIHEQDRNVLFVGGMKKAINNVKEYCIVPSWLVPEAVTHLPAKKRDLEYQVIYYREG